MRKIPDEVLEEIMKDWFYKKCCVADEKCSGRIEWHHNLIYAGKQVNEKWCILPLLQGVHRDIVKYKEKCNWIMVNRMTDEQLNKYSKAINYRLMKANLNHIYGKYNRT